MPCWPSSLSILRVVLPSTQQQRGRERTYYSTQFHLIVFYYGGYIYNRVMSKESHNHDYSTIYIINNTLIP